MKPFDSLGVSPEVAIGSPAVVVLLSLLTEDSNIDAAAPAAASSNDEQCRPNPS